MDGGYSDRASKFFPDFGISTIKKIGEGTGNTAFEVNSDFIFRFPKRPENQKQLERAILYGKCLLFEDLYFGIGQEEYEQKAFNALERMF